MISAFNMHCTDSWQSARDHGDLVIIFFTDGIVNAFDNWLFGKYMINDKIDFVLHKGGTSNHLARAAFSQHTALQNQHQSAIKDIQTTYD